MSDYLIADALAEITDRLTRIEHQARTVTVSELGIDQPADVYLEPTDYAVMRGGVRIGKIIHHFGTQWHALWWVGDEQQSKMFDSRADALAAIITSSERTAA